VPSRPLPVLCCRTYQIPTNFRLEEGGSDVFSRFFFVAGPLFSPDDAGRVLKWSSLIRCEIRLLPHEEPGEDFGE